MPNTPIKSVTVPQGQTTVTVDLHDARIISIDNQLVENSTNPVTSGAVYAVVGDIDTVLDGKANLVDGKVPAAELPSYVDDVVEYANASSFPATGESGKIYIATDTNKAYRWSGSAYAEISESLALGETTSTAYAGNKGKANADAIAAIKDGTTIDSFADVETALANIPSVTVDQTYDATSTNAQSGVAIEGKKPGLNTAGTRYTIDGSSVLAQKGAEVFNNYTINKASGACSHAEGYGTTASGQYSHAEGNGTTASGESSHAEGYQTIAASLDQHVLGKYNVKDANNTYAFIIGNGTSNNARHNAFAIDWDGLVYVNGVTTGVDVSQCITPTDYATQTTGGTIKAWTTTDGSDTILHLATQ